MRGSKVSCRYSYHSDLFKMLSEQLFADHTANQRKDNRTGDHHKQYPNRKKTAQQVFREEHIALNIQLRIEEFSYPRNNFRQDAVTLPVRITIQMLPCSSRNRQGRIAAIKFHWQSVSKCME